MKKFVRIITTLAVLAIVGLNAVPAYASDLAEAQYMRSLVVANSGAETTNNVVTFDPATLEMITSGLINSSLTGSAITDLANNDLVYMPKEPVRYKLLEYLESDGNQYTDTGYKPNDNSKVVLDFQFVEQPPNWTPSAGCQQSSAGSNANTFLLAQTDSGGHIRTINEGRVNGTYTGYQASINFDTNRHTTILDASLRFASIDSTTNSSTNTSIIYSLLPNLHLFESNGANFGPKVKIYSSQIYENGTIVRDFVPVERTTDNALGMLDRINGVFYPNIGTGTFSVGNLTNTLYVCDYLESSGSQYINTGITPQTTETVNVSFALLPNSNTSAVMGVRWVDNNVYRLYNLFWVSASNITFYNRGANISLGDEIRNTRLDVSAETVNDTTSYVWYNGTRYTKSVTDHTVTTYPITLFASLPAGNYAIEQIYRYDHFTSYKQDRNLIPVYNATTQIAGFWDIAGNSWYGNSGTGSFSYKLSGNDGTWCLYLPTVAANTSITERLYISTENLNSKISYFPGATGLTVNRNTTNTVSGSDDWNFTIKGRFHDGDGTYLFKYGDDLFATMSGNTITMSYGSITLPLSGIIHNTSWAYYYGTTGSGYSFTGDGNITYQTNYISQTQNNLGPNGTRGVRTTSTITGYNTMIVKATQNNTYSSLVAGYSTTAANYPATRGAVTSGSLYIRSLPTSGAIYPAVGMYNSKSSTDSIGQHIYMIAFAKADSPWQYQGLAQYGSSNAAILANAATLVNDPYALYVLATKCTGDFMWAAVNTSAFTTALASSPYKNILYASEDWCKALAWNTGSYSTTSVPPVTLSFTQQVPLGVHTYDFRKEGNNVSIYVDAQLVRGGVFSETLWATAAAAQNKTYSQIVAYDTDAQISFAQGGTTLYADLITQKKNGNTVGQWTWAQTDTFTFPDASSQGNTGYPSFRETNYGSVNNGANLSVSYGTYQPANVAQYNAPSSGEASTFTGLLPEIEQPEQDVDLDRIKNVPFASVFEALLGAGNIPSQLFWLPVMMTFAIAACGVAYHLTRDALISCIAGDVMLGLGCALSLTYTVPLVIGIVTTIVLLVKRKTISL